MITNTDVELKQQDLGGLVIDKFLVDAFKPKICHERDIMVIAFSVKQKDSAEYLSSYLAQGMFDVIDVDASDSPDENGHYLVLVEMPRNREMFRAMDNILKHLTDLGNIQDWHFKPYAYEEYIDWNEENFIKTVPQNPDAYFSEDTHQAEVDHFDAASSPRGSSVFDFKFFGEAIEKQIIKSTRTYIKTLQKQFKSYMKANNRLFQSIEDLRSDHQYLHQQLDLYEKREKMAILREQQDYKHIRTLENKLSLLAPADSQFPEMVAPDSSIPITVQSYEISGAASESKEDMDIVREAKDQQTVIDSDSSASGENPSIKDMSESPIDTSEDSPVDVTSQVDNERQERDSETHRPIITSPDFTAEASPSPAPEKTESDEISSGSSFGQDTPVTQTPVEVPKSSTASKKIDTASETDTFIWGSDDFGGIATQPESALAGESDDGSVEKEAMISVTASDASQPAASALESASESDLAKEHIAQGLAAVGQKDYEKAIEYFIKTVDLIPDSPRIFLNLAVLYYRLNDYANAREYAQRALDLGAEFAKRILRKVEAKLTKSSDETLSTETFSEAILWGADDLEKEDITQEAGAAEKSDKVDVTKKKKKAKTGSHPTLNEAPKQDPGSPTYQPVSKHQEAKTAIESFLSQGESADASVVSPPSKSAAKGSSKNEAAKKYFTYGLRAFEQKKYDKAIKCFKKVTQLFPNARRSFIRLAIVYYRLKNYEKARECAQRAFDLGSKSAQRILEKVETKMATSPQTSTVDEFADTLPEFPTLDFNQIVSSPKTKADEKDEDVVEKKRKIDEQPDKIKEDSDQETGDREELRDKKSPKLKPSSPPIVPENENDTANDVTLPSMTAAHASPKGDNAEEYFNLGLAAAEQKDYEKAIQYFTKVTTLLPDAPPSFLNLANIQLELKDYDAAREHAQRAMDLGSESAKRVLEKIEAERWTSAVMSPKQNQPDLSEANL